MKPRTFIYNGDIEGGYPGVGLVSKGQQVIVTDPETLRHIRLAAPGTFEEVEEPKEPPQVEVQPTADAPIEASRPNVQDPPPPEQPVEEEVKATAPRAGRTGRKGQREK